MFNHSRSPGGTGDAVPHPLRRTSRILAALAALATALVLTVTVQAPAEAAIGFPATADLNGRSGKSLTAPVVRVDMYLSGQTVNVVCQDRGELAYGSYIWDRTTDGVWVPDTYVRTGYSGFHPSLPRCSDMGGDGRTFTAKADLNGRSSPSLSARVVQEDMYRSGQSLNVVCQTTGGNAYGSTIWDKTSDNVYVPDHYVQTGYSGFHPSLPRCQDGAPGSQGFTAKVDLAGRDARSTSATEVKTYPAGSAVSIVCQAIGENAYGSNIWDKTSDGLWVADHYVKTGYSTFHPDLPRCDDGGSGGGGGNYTAKVDLAGRDAKKTSATEVKTYAAGSTIDIVCQAYGGYAYGSYIWDKTSDGLWVADHYVKTGTDGFISGMPRCDNDQPTQPDGGTAPEPGDCSMGHGRINGPRGSTAGTRQERIDRVVSTARAMTGRGYEYSWGAGGKGGVACGSGAISPGGYNDYNRLGFDCSGLTLYAFWKGAGIDIGSYTTAQYHSSYGTKIPFDQRQPGDLIFWGANASAHVAIYIGDDQMIEAAPPRNGNSVHVTSVYQGNQRMPYVVRYI
ncbi:MULTISPECIES: NlpC/P60 family protein [unclassified Nocardiopsis]|uniref:NlpC/P60 family protein n=1 Tax=unclassified Nocardiopsis TaxID=2649073 RepID=UPI0013573601|nr:MULTISPECIES: NlpC/P60 family protein [unclassified Nocardiopsis]